MLSRIVAIALFSCLGLAFTPLAQGQTPVKGFSLNRFTPADPGSDWLSLDSLKLNGHLRYSFNATSDYARKPLVLYGPSGKELGAPVSDQLYLHLGGAVMLADHVRISASLPLLVINEGKGGALNNQLFSSDEGIAVGDLRLGSDVRLFGTHGDPLTVSAGLQIHLPTGNRKAYASDGKPRLVPRVQAAGEMGMWIYAARLAFDGRFLQSDFGDRPFGNELAFAAAAGIQFADKRLIVGPELFGSTVVSDGAAFKAKATPIEAVLSARYRITDEMGIGVSGGPGFSHALGSPAVRFLASFVYAPVFLAEPPSSPPLEIHDLDGDGISDGQDACPTTSGPERPAPETNGCPDSDGDTFLDSLDACPLQPGDPNDDPKKHGCSIPKDLDQDGILDLVDACPNEVGVANADPKKYGCPILPDADSDGVPDRDDACREVAGAVNDDPAQNGCRPDKDRDFIFDSHDACPEVPGEPDPLPSKNGCPKVELAGKEIKVLESIEFELNKANIRSESINVLSGVLRVLNEHPELTKIRIEAYTDDEGNAAANKQLSKARAEAVAAWFVTLGLQATRFEAVGYGKEKPLGSSKTEEGRAANRRIRFSVISGNGNAP
ncbi:MAG: OmpA family protein [Deltaproteobacteria bacterium]|nr:OmpA family protein [Deltaproteobacteria bacterium]